MNRPMAFVLVAAALGGGWSTEKGRRFDVHAQTSGRAAKVSKWAEDTARAFEDLLVLFPGKRAAVLVGFQDLGVGLPPGIGGVRPDAPDPPAPGPDESWRFRAPGESLLAVQGSLVARAADEETRFRHMLGHCLLAEWTKRLPDGGPKPDGSGCPLPDWLEEAVAVDMEPDSRKQEYRKAFGEMARKEKVWGLDALLGMQRPTAQRRVPFDLGGLAGRMPPSPEPPPELPPEERERIKRLLGRILGDATGELAADHAEGLLFEVQSWCLLDFLRREFDVEFVRHVADTVGSGRGFSNCYPWLVKHRPDLRNPKATPPGTDREMEAAWMAWAKRQ